MVNSNNDFAVMLVAAFVFSLGIVGTFYMLCEEGYLVANMSVAEYISSVVIAILLGEPAGIIVVFYSCFGLLSPIPAIVILPLTSLIFFIFTHLFR